MSLSTLADQVGACCAALTPLIRRLEAHVFAAERPHGDNTPVPVLAKGKTGLGRCWVHVRADRPFGGKDPPAAMFCYFRDRSGEHPQAHLARYAGLFQADAFGGYTALYERDRKPGRSWRRPTGSMPAPLLRPGGSGGKRPAARLKTSRRW